MAIANTKTTATASPKYQEQPTITSPEYKHAVVDSQYTPMTGLLTSLPGMKLNTIYYHQVVGRNEGTGAFDPTQQGPYQQYRKIVNFEILLQGSLSTDIDTETQTTRTTGSAIIYPGLVPIDGDAFIMDAGDGRASQCTVMNSKRLTMFRDAAFEITFVVSRFMTDELEDIINSRVVLTHYFHKDFLNYGQNPFLVEDDHNSLLSLEKAEENLIQVWSRRYWNPAISTFIVPSQWSLCYDPFFIKFILSIMPIYDHNEYRNINVLNCDDHNFANLYSVWDMLLKRDDFILYDIFKEARLISTATLNNRALFNSVRYSGVANIVGPSVYDTGYGIGEMDYSAASGWSINTNCNCKANNYENGLGFKADATVNDGSPGMDIPELFVDNSYVFSKAFYEGDKLNMSEFERLLYRGLYKESINPSEVMAFYKTVNKWSKLDQFYLIPTLILIIRYSQRSI